MWIEELKHTFHKNFSGTKFNLEDFTSDFNASKLALLDIALDQSMSKRLYDKTAIFLANVYDECEYFVTSNYPYVAMPDIGSSNSLHIMPLSPKICLIMSPNTELIQFMRNKILNLSSRSSFVKMVNFVVSTYSSEVYSWAGSIPKDISDYIGLYGKDSEKSRQMFRAKLDAIERAV